MGAFGAVWGGLCVVWVWGFGYRGGHLGGGMGAIGRYGARFGLGVLIWAIAQI